MAAVAPRLRDPRPGEADPGSTHVARFVGSPQMDILHGRFQRADGVMITYVTLGWDDGSLTARLPGMTRHEAGQMVSVSLAAEHLLLFDRESGRRIESPAPG